MVRFDNDPARLKREIARAGQAPKVVLEATLGWYWASDALGEARAEVHLAGFVHEGGQRLSMALGSGR